MTPTDAAINALAGIACSYAVELHKAMCQADLDDLERIARRITDVLKARLRAELEAHQAAASQAATSVAQATPPELSPTESGVIRDLIALARVTFLALDDSEEFEGDNGRCHSISGQDFDDVEKALDVLDELPDDKPGYTLATAGKAEWALRRILAPMTFFDLKTAPEAQHGDALPREDFARLVVQEACETEPADPDDPECIRILRLDLKSAVLAAFLRHDRALASLA